ncbi:TetR/AcrR family transcriptional regulator [Flavitalea flava]
MTKAEKTRQFIVTQAAPVINKKGMAGTSISDIMEVTKLAKGGIYGNFKNKEEICVEVFDFLYKRLYANLTDLLKKETTSKGKLFALLDFYRDRLVLNEIGGCPILNFGIEADDTDPLVKTHVAEAIRTLQNNISHIVRQGIKYGEFVPTWNDKEFAIKMFTLIEGAILTSRVLGSNAQMKIITDILKKEIGSFCL